MYICFTRLRETLAIVLSEQQQRKRKRQRQRQQAMGYGQQANCLYTNEPDIMMITEVIPKAQQNSISYPQLSIKGYDTYVSFNPSEVNLGASGIRGVAI